MYVGTQIIVQSAASLKFLACIAFTAQPGPPTSGMQWLPWHILLRSRRPPTLRLPGLCISSWLWNVSAEIGYVISYSRTTRRQRVGPRRYENVIPASCAGKAGVASLSVAYRASFQGPCSSRKIELPLMRELTWKIGTRARSDRYYVSGHRSQRGRRSWS